MEVHAMSDDSHPDDIGLPNGPLHFTTATNEGTALSAVLRGNEDGSVAALKTMNYAELYLLRVALEKLHTLTCIRLEKVR